MKKLIIETFDLVENYSRFEALLVFYPYGLKGLIADHVNNQLENSWSCATRDESDQAFFDTVLSLYQHSLEYSHHPAKEQNENEQMLMLVFMGIGNTVRHLLEQYQTEFQRSRVDIETMQWGEGYMLLEMH